MSGATQQRARRAALSSPRVLIPVVGALALALVGMGVAYAMKDGGQVLSLASCEAGTPGCELRQAAHDHADFAIFIEGERFDFGQSRFISTEENEKSMAAHIHDPRHTVVHVHYSNTTWDEFLRSLGVTLDDPTMPGGSAESASITMPDGREYRSEGGKTLKFYVNGVRVDGIAFTTIADLDRVLISYGSETPEEVEQQQLPLLSDEACIPSERCHERIPADEPPEPCARSSSTCG